MLGSCNYLCLTVGLQSAPAAGYSLKGLLNVLEQIKSSLISSVMLDKSDLEKLHLSAPTFFSKYVLNVYTPSLLSIKLEYVKVMLVHITETTFSF